MKYLTDSEKETTQLAQKIAQEYKNKPGVIALIGELGAGKTTFAAGFAKGLGIKDKIISPTFVLIRQHPIPRQKQILYHVDLYRLDQPINITELGLRDLFSQDNIVLIEWAEKIKDSLPKDTLFINFEKISDKERQIEVG